jgi:uncharacterized protein
MPRQVEPRHAAKPHRDFCKETAMPRLTGKFVWFEHSSPDTAKARAFYEALLGWHTESMLVGDQRYSMIMAGNEAIGAYTTSQPDGVPCWKSYLSVDDVDATYKAALAAGGRSFTAPMDFGGVGRGAEVADPTGARLWLWKGASDDPADKATAVAGHWCWNELSTSDEKKAIAFYEKVIGYSHDSMDMGNQFMYHVLKKDGAMRAGVMKAMEPGMPSAWLPYVAVDDCDASAAKAAKLGAQVVHGPQDIPNVGRFAVLVDPLGAALAIMRDSSQSG